MLKWFKKKPHVHAFKTVHFSTVINLDNVVRFERCNCGMERIVTIHNSGVVEIRYGDENQ